MEELICPNTSICPIYKNWIDYTKDNRLNIIQQHKNPVYGDIYSCLALNALFDAETGIPKNQELKKRLNTEKVDCALIQLLNNPKK